MNTGWQYNFPAHGTVAAGQGRGYCAATQGEGIPRAWFEQQLGKIREEVDELGDAIYDGETGNRVLEECLDAAHAIETMLRAWSPDEVKAKRDFVVVKNRERGYYGRSDG